MTKTYRQAQILKLIRAESIRTQEELSLALQKIGIAVTQVTLSRDVRELGLVKTPSGYQEPRQAAASGPEEPDTLTRVVQEFVREVQVAQNLVVIKTASGNAPPVAVALDKEAWPEVVGTVAGEDTVFAVAPDAKRAQQAKEKLLALLR